MKLNKIITGAALLLCAASIGAQSLELHGEVDATAYGVGQTFSKTGDADWDHTDARAGLEDDIEKSFYRVDLKLNAANFEFNLGLKLPLNLNDDSEYYTDYTDSYDGTPFYQGNMKVQFFNQQMNVFLGKFEDFNAGYIFDGYVLGSQNIRNLADRKEGQYFTAIEVTPYIIRGLRLLAGIPILPVGGNGVQNDRESNQWKNLYKKVKVAAGYELEGVGKFTAGWRPGTYYTGVKAYDASSSTSAFLDNYFGEAFVQADLTKLFDTLGLGIKFNVSYDFRYRDDASYKSFGMSNGALSYETKEHFAAAHYFGLSADFSELIPLSELSLAAESRTFYADDDYIASDEKLFMQQLGLSGEWNFSGTKLCAGLDFVGNYAQDANGTAFTYSASDGYAAVSRDHFDDVQLGWNNMPSTCAPASGDPTKYIGLYFAPYVKYNFANGYAKTGVEVLYSTAIGKDDTNTAVSYRVPLALVFNF